MRKQFREGTLSRSDCRDGYLRELRDHRAKLREMAGTAKQQQVTLVFGAKDEEHNNAVVLKEYLGRLDGDFRKNDHSIS